MKKWSRLTAFMLAIAIMLSNVSGALALVEVNFDTLMQWIQNVKDYHGLGDVIKLIRGGVQQIFFDPFEEVDYPLYPDGETTISLDYSADEKNVELSRYGKVQLSAPAAGQWQVYLNAADTWVNVADETGSTFELTYAKVESLFEQNGSAKLRNVAGDSVTQTANVGLTYAVAAMPATAEDDGLTYSVRAQDNSGIMLAAEGDEPELAEVHVVIKFMLGNQEAFSDYTAQLNKGGNLKTTVPVPALEGYIAEDYETADEFNGTADMTEATQTVAGKIELDLQTITTDITLIVYYQPDYVRYTVKHFLQNLDGTYPEEVGDQYTNVYTNTKTGQTVTAVNTTLARDIEGFSPLWYDKEAKVVSDGTTVVNIRYEREYHLIKFDLQSSDAYGTEPVYACYGTPLGNIPNPTRPGYTFAGWQLNGANATLPETMPAEDRTYTALWTPKDLAKVTVVFWGENANDEEYAYQKTGTLFVEPGTSFTYSDDDTRFIICGKEAHTHDENCVPTLICTIPLHEQHNVDCCTKTEHTAHTISCFNNVGAQANPNNAPTNNLSDGRLYRTGWLGSYTYYIYISGTWYRYNGTVNNYNSNPYVNPTCSGLHSHGDGNCSCNQTLHSHSEPCYVYSCGLTAHTHVAACYQNGSGMDADLWELVESETVTVAADGTSIVNVYFDRKEFTFTFRRDGSTIHSFTAKWGANIRNKWTFTGSDGRNYAPTGDNATSWSPSGSQTYTQRIFLILTMPAENITFTRNQSSNRDRTFYYYVEALPGVPEGKVFENVNYTLEFELVNNFGTLYYKDDFFELEGFTRYKSARPNGTEYPLGNGGTSPIDNLHFYYKRNNYDLVFYNGNAIDKVYSDNTNKEYASTNGSGVPYQLNLNSYYYVPELPTGLYQPGSRVFDGWYLNPECTGDEVILSETTMPLDGLILYAKWEPAYHTVRFYMDKDDMEAGTELETHPSRTELHGTSIEVANPTNGEYDFDGWFYMDGETEKAYDFENMPILKDLQVYGKWSADDPLEFTVYYKLKDENGNETDIEVAAPTTGMALHGDDIPLEAKTALQLYEDYRSGCFPEVVSHALDIDIDDESSRTYTFWYRQVGTMPYTVNHIKVTYVDGVRTEELVESKVENTANAIVTERYMNIPGYAPDAYQKRLVISTNAADNVINFYYELDKVNAIYSVVHKTQPLGVTTGDLENYVQYGVEFNERVAIDSVVKAERETLQGFTFREAIITQTSIAEDGTVQEPVVSRVTDLTTAIETVLTNGGVTFELYYDRNEYPYTVRYLLNEPDTEGNYPQILDPKTGNGFYQERITETAPEIPGYYIGNNTSSITIGIDDATGEPENLIEFYYNENFVTINYKVVGPEGATNFGTVDLNDDDPSTVAGEQVSEENIKVIHGNAVGATAEPTSNAYKFVGWYLDEACTIPVTAADGTLSGETEPKNSFVPAKEAEVKEGDKVIIPAMYERATFYAKFEYNLTYLTIKKEGDTVASDDTFVFRIDGDNAEGMQVVIQGTNSVTVYGLTVGETYTVTEIAHNFRYGDYTMDCTSDEGKYTVDSDKGEITFEAAPDRTKNVITFTNKVTNNQWLDDDDYEPNAFAAKQ